MVIRLLFARTMFHSIRLLVSVYVNKSNHNDTQLQCFGLDAFLTIYSNSTRLPNADLPGYIITIVLVGVTLQIFFIAALYSIVHDAILCAKILV